MMGANKAIQLIKSSQLEFENPAADVHVACQRISNCAWVDTKMGAVAIDTLLTAQAGEKVLEQIHRSGLKVKYIIYSHGHLDHVGGAEAFLEDKPEIVAHQFLSERLQKYQMLAAHRNRIANIQFNLNLDDGVTRKFIFPKTTFYESMTLTLGEKTFELYHARAETDDHCWVWVPEIKTAFVGDLLIGSFPNIGNPFKPTRFALPWAKALQAVRDKAPKMIIAGGGRAVYKDGEVQAVLDDTIAGILAVHDQVVDLINANVSVEDMVRQVKLPENLRNSPYLQFRYSRPEFAVYNIYRWYHGYFDFNPAHLLPLPQEQVAAEIMGLIGDGDKVLERVRHLVLEDKKQLALQVLSTLLQYDPEHLEGRKLRLEILEAIVADDECVMSRNTYIHYINEDKEFLRAKGAPCW